MQSFPPEIIERVLSNRSSVEYISVSLEEFFERRGISNKLMYELAKKLPDGAMIAGGSIASMLLKERINDIDIFFQTEEAFRETTALLRDGEVVVDPEPSLLERYKLTTNMEFFDEAPEQVRFLQFKDSEGTRPPIQLVKVMWYVGPATLIESFDFTVTQFAITNQNVVFNPISLIDVFKKRLVLHKMTFPASTVRRLIKYTRKNFFVCPGSMQAITLAIAEMGVQGLDKVNGIVYVD